MRQGRIGSFLAGLFLTVIWRVSYWMLSLPAWITLILHFALGLSIVWFWVTLAAWLISGILQYLMVLFARRCAATKDEKRENKNPYSVKSVPTVKGNSPEKEDPRMCPCCYKFRFDEVGKYEICSVCGWEDDPLQRRDPDLKGGANTLSLNEARYNYLTGKEK